MLCHTMYIAAILGLCAAFMPSRLQPPRSLRMSHRLPSMAAPPAQALERLQMMPSATAGRLHQTGQEKARRLRRRQQTGQSHDNTTYRKLMNDSTTNTKQMSNQSQRGQQWLRRFDGVRNSKPEQVATDLADITKSHWTQTQKQVNESRATQRCCLPRSLTLMTVKNQKSDQVSRQRIGSRPNAHAMQRLLLWISEAAVKNRYSQGPSGGFYCMQQQLERPWSISSTAVASPRSRLTMSAAAGRLIRVANMRLT